MNKKTTTERAGKIKFIVLSLYVPVFLCFIVPCYADPQPPQLVSVSVDPATSIVTISWQASPTPNIDRYTLFVIRINEFGFSKGDTIAHLLPDQLNYSFVAPNKKEIYYLRADSASIYSGPTSQHVSMATSFVFDSCNKRLTLYWDAYTGWSSGVKHYKVYDFNSGQLLGTTPYTNFSLENIDANTLYSCYVVAESNTSVMASSFRAEKYTAMPKPPTYIIGTATVIEENIICTFTIDPNSEYSHYTLSRTNSSSGNFSLLKEYTSYYEKTIQYTDTEVKATTNTYYYKLSAINSCGVVDVSALPVNNMVLTVTNSRYINTLEWTRYKPYRNDVKYSATRIIAGSSKMIFTDISEQTAMDDLSVIQRYTEKNKLSADFCYYVSVNDSGSESRSNIACAYIIPDIVIPNAFTPNGDGKNDTFVPLLDFLPKQYFFVIYNRFGNKLFQTNDPQASWDGSYGGKKVPQGVYVYSVSLTSFDDRTIYKTGEVTVVYP